MPTLADRPATPIKGVALVILATLAFALSDVLTKSLASRNPVEVVIAVRYVVNLGLLLVLFYPGQGARLWATQRTGLVILRALCLAFASLTMAYALKWMPVGETVAIVYLHPFLVMALAIPFLGERVSLGRWVGAMVGFAGVLLILRPGGGLAFWGVVMALVNAGFATAYTLMTRALSRTETTHALLFMVALVGTVFFCLSALPHLDGLAMSGRDYLLSAALGVLATTGHFLFTSAYREAPASMLAPVNYLHLVWAGGLGFMFFGDVPTPVSLIGMGLVAGAGAWIAWRGARPG